MNPLNSVGFARVTPGGSEADGSEADEEDGAGSLSSNSSLECMSTSVPIGHDPFAWHRHGRGQNEAVPQFQYSSLASATLAEDSRCGALP